MVGAAGFEPAKPEAADLQSAGFEPLPYTPETRAHVRAGGAGWASISRIAEGSVHGEDVNRLGVGLSSGNVIPGLLCGA